jgi:hypothetical protein
MREVFVSDRVMNKVSDLRIYLIEELKLSRKAAHKRTDRINTFLMSFATYIKLKPGSPAQTELTIPVFYLYKTTNARLFSFQKPV